MSHWIIEKAGLFDFATSQFSPALQIDWNYHIFTNLVIRLVFLEISVNLWMHSLINMPTRGNLGIITIGCKTYKLITMKLRDILEQQTNTISKRHILLYRNNFHTGMEVIYNDLIRKPRIAGSHLDRSG